MGSQVSDKDAQYAKDLAYIDESMESQVAVIRERLSKQKRIKNPVFSKMTVVKEK